MVSEFANEIADICLKQYENLPKKGKPIPDKEWTLLSSVVMSKEENLTVVALATGTKCLGRNKMSPKGILVNDSHAEVLARRCFLRYIYDQILNFKSTGTSDIVIGCNEKNEFVINPKVKFHFYSSHVPCGDASIISKVEDHEKKRKSEQIIDESSKRKKIEESCSEFGDECSEKEDYNNQRKDIDEDLRNMCQKRFTETFLTRKQFEDISADEDLRKIPQKIKLTDEDLRLGTSSDKEYAKSFQPTNQVCDEDMRNIPEAINNLKHLNYLDEDLRIPNKHNEGTLVKKIYDQDDRTLHLINEHKNTICNEKIKIVDEDLRTNLKYDEDLRNICYDEDLRYSVNKDKCVINCDRLEELNEEHQDCVGELLDIHRTGAKCVAGEDSKKPGVLYHVVGAVRTKPGRGDPTLSVSCSDKLARWIACGVQGALLSLILAQPILLDSVVIGGGGPFSKNVLQRALLNRTGTYHQPRLAQSSSVFPHSRYRASPTAKPCPSAILWTRLNGKSLEVCVEGRRQGSTKKCHESGNMMVCKLEFLKAFLLVSGDKYRGMTYRTIKSLATRYNNVWAQARSKLGVWTSKPQYLEDFTID